MAEDAIEQAEPAPSAQKEKEGWQRVEQTASLELTGNQAVKKEIENRWELGAELLKAALGKDLKLPDFIKEQFPDAEPDEISDLARRIGKASFKSRPPAMWQTRPDIPRGQRRTRYNRDITAMEAGPVFHRQVVGDRGFIEAIGSRVKEDRVILPRAVELVYDRTVKRWGNETEKLEGEVRQCCYATVGWRQGRRGRRYLDVALASKSEPLWDEESAGVLARHANDMDYKARVAERITKWNIAHPLEGGAWGSKS